MNKENKRIAGQHKFTGERITMWYPSISEAQRRNKYIVNMEYV